MNATVEMPVPSPATAPFWAAARDSRLLMPRCRGCGRFSFPAPLACPHCDGVEMEWTEVSGRGTVFSFVVYHRVYHPAFADKVPYVVAVIALEEGPRLISNVVGIAPGEVRCDMPVSVVFEEISDGVRIPKFAPRPPSDG
jgi:uncharacterized OB-fold protein